MDDLRLALLVIGVLIVIGVYLWDIGEYKDESSADYKPANTEKDDFPSDVSPIGDKVGGNDEMYQDEMEEGDSNQEEKNGSAKDLELDQTDTSQMDIVQTISDSPSDTDFSHGVDVAIDTSDRNDLGHPLGNVPKMKEVGNLSIKMDGEKENDLQLSKSGLAMLLYIEPKESKDFKGLLIYRATQEIGMVYGERHIFHYFKERSQVEEEPIQPLFSMTDMYEPGIFDLATFAEARVRGLSIFAYADISREDLNLFIERTKQFTRLIDGEIFNSDRQPIDNDGLLSLIETSA